MSNSRALLILSLMCAFFAVLSFRLFKIQISEHENYKFYAERQQNRLMPLKAERGIIQDRNGDVLAYTKNDLSFYADLRMLNDKRKQKIADTLSLVFGKSKAYYQSLFSEGKRNICLEKKAPKEKGLRLSNFVVDGLFRQDDFTREYPYGHLASHIIGYVNSKLDGVAGIERTLNAPLKGHDGSLVVERDVRGRTVSFDEEFTKPAVPGAVVSLTINKEYQKILEEELIQGVAKYQGKSGVGIIMDPHTGEILALANVPDYNPMEYNLFDDEARRNRALTDTFEPGSTIKSVVMSILIDQKKIRTDEYIATGGGRANINKAVITDSHSFGTLSVKGILEHSSNIGMAKLSTRLDADTFYRYMRDFGFGSPTSIELPGEAAGVLKKPYMFTGSTKLFMSFGYEMSATPMQLITAYSALINGGYLLRPFIIKKVSDPNGNVLKQTFPLKIRQVIQNSTSDMIRNLMYGVVENGTGEFAKVEGVRVGGKTGTSQKIIGNKYSKGNYNSSFIGFFPADNPKVLCFVLVNSPALGLYGGQVAAPIFRNVAERMIKSGLDVSSGKSFQKLMTKSAPSAASKKFADLPEGKYVPVVRRVPYSPKGLMPNLRNCSLRDAMSSLSQSGLRYRVVGSGPVQQQSIAPNTRVKPGTICILKCGMPKNIKVNIN